MYIVRFAFALRRTLQDTSLNKAIRQLYKHDVKKSFYKLMNNAPYGRTIENVARRTDIRLLNDMEKSRKLAEKPHSLDFRVFDGNVKQHLG